MFFNFGKFHTSVGTYFYMDHTRKALVTALQNLITESQKYANHVISEKESRLEWRFAKKLLPCWWIFFVKTYFEKAKKTRERLAICLGESMILSSESDLL